MVQRLHTDSLRFPLSWMKLNISCCFLFHMLPWQWKRYWNALCEEKSPVTRGFPSQRACKHFHIITSLCVCKTAIATPWIILGMGSPKERRRYFVTHSLIGWAHTQNDPGDSETQLTGSPYTVPLTTFIIKLAVNGYCKTWLVPGKWWLGSPPEDQGLGCHNSLKPSLYAT